MEIVSTLWDANLSTRQWAMSATFKLVWKQISKGLIENEHQSMFIETTNTEKQTIIKYNKIYLSQ